MMPVNYFSISIYAYTQTFLQYFKMTKLKETKVEDIILMYNYIKRINQQYRGKLFNNVIKSRKIIDDFDKEGKIDYILIRSLS